MTILDRKKKACGCGPTSDLIWAPSPAPTDGTVGDVNTMLIGPSHLGMAQDVILAKDGTLRSRGGLLTAAAAQTVQPLVLLQSLASTAYVGLHNAGNGDFYCTTATNLTGFAKTTIMGEDNSLTSQNVSSDTSLFSWSAVKFPDAPGGIFCGGSFSSVAASKVSTFMWGGNAVTVSNTSVGTFSTTALGYGDTAITGVGTAWTSALVGCYLFTSIGQLVGQVASVASTTALTLTLGAWIPATAVTPIFKTARTLRANPYKGRITSNSTSVSLVGSGTKWLNSDPNKINPSGDYLASWALLRLSDGKYIGQIGGGGVTSDTSATLGVAAKINMSNEEWYAVRESGTPAAGVSFPCNYFAAGCAEYYADRYWYGNFYTQGPFTGFNVPAYSGNASAWCQTQYPTSLTFTKKGQPEMFDLSPATGDILTLPTLPGFGGELRALKATRGGMLVLRGADTYFLTGYSPETFKTIKILDDGCHGNSFVKTFAEGVIWAGNKSIWYFDGSKVTDLLDKKVKKFYQDNMIGPGVGQPGGASFSNDHFMYSATVNSATWPVGNTTGTILGITLVINMLNGAVSFFTNLFAYGSAPINVSGTFVEDVLLAGNGSPVTATTGQFLKGSTLFTESTVATDNVDAANYFTTFTAAPNLGPQVLFESVKYSLKDATRMKFFKVFLMNYMSDKSMTVMVTGTNQASGFPNTATGTVVATAFPVNSTNSILKKIRFLIRAPSISVRVYQTAVPIATQSQRFKLFWYTIGGKFMRIGRAQ